MTSADSGQLPAHDMQDIRRTGRCDLSNRGLTTLPPEIGRLTSLRAVTLNRNQLTALPPEIGQLRGLQALALNHNQLT